MFYCVMKVGLFILEDASVCLSEIKGCGQTDFHLYLAPSIYFVESLQQCIAFNWSLFVHRLRKCHRNSIWTATGTSGS